jgi:hypothetical protein
MCSQMNSLARTEIKPGDPIRYTLCWGKPKNRCWGIGDTGTVTFIDGPFITAERNGDSVIEVFFAEEIMVQPLSLLAELP